jgi:hypothetical protein
MLIKSVIAVFSLLMLAWAPIAPAPVTVHFVTGTTLEQAQSALTGHTGQQGWFYTTYTNPQGRTIGQATRGVAAALAAPVDGSLPYWVAAGPVTADRIELYNLTAQTRQALAANPHVAAIEAPIQPLANANFFLNQLSRLQMNGNR